MTTPDVPPGVAKAAQRRVALAQLRAVLARRRAAGLKARHAAKIAHLERNS